jgi:hypothetical protein
MHPGSLCQAATAARASDRSRVLCERLTAELASLTTVEDLPPWALRRLPPKNNLQGPDEAINATYQAKLDTLQAAVGADQFSQTAKPQDDSPPKPPARLHLSHRRMLLLAPSNGTEAQASPKAVNSLPKTLRRRNKHHLAFVASQPCLSQPCLVCKRVPCDAHHRKFVQPRSL